jgi:isopentenyl phosphate kinase
MKNLIFIKLGGSLITDKSRPYTIREDVIKRVCREIHEAREGSNSRVLIGHGGGSFPHVSASKYETHKGLINDNSWEGFVRVQNDAAKLNRIIVSSLIEAGEKAISIQPSASCIARGDQIIEWYTKPIESALSKGLIPVPYGDVCLDLKKEFCIISTEEVFRFLAKKLKPERVIMAGKTDGVFDSGGKVVNEITKNNLNKIKKSLMSSDGIADVTGGMVLKVEKSMGMGVEVEIVNGLKANVLKKSLLGERGLGTVIRG